MLNFLEKNVEAVNKIKTIPENSAALILALTKIFVHTNFKTRKIIIKAFLNSSFFKFFEKESSVFLFVLAFLSKINEEAVYNITLVKLFKQKYETSDLTENIHLQKIFAVLLARDVDKRVQADKSLFINAKTLELVNLTSLNSDRVHSNVKYLLGQIFETADALPNSSSLIKECYANSNFSTLIGSLFEYFLTSKIIRRRPQQLPFGVLQKLFPEDRVQRKEPDRGREGLYL